MDSLRIKWDRDAVVAFYRSQPSYFDSSRRSMSIETWLHDMEQTFTMCHIEEHLQVTLASRCLSGDARMWWATLGEPQLPSRTWAHFRAVVMARYGPLPARGPGEPARDPEIYRAMRQARYQRLSEDWHAYPGETMRHYCLRFQESMLPHIPQEIADHELQALMLMRRGIPQHIQRFVPVPTEQMVIGSYYDDIIEAEEKAQAVPAEPAAEAQAPDADDDQEDPQYEVGPLEEDPMDSDDDSDDVVPIDPPAQPDPPVIVLSSDDEDDPEGDAAYEEWDDPDEYLDDDALDPVIVLSDSDTSVSTVVDSE